MMNIVDKKILNEIRNITPEERNALMKIFDISKHELNTQLILAIFRDSIVFRDMTQALILNYKLKMIELEERLEKIENYEKGD